MARKNRYADFAERIRKRYETGIKNMFWESLVFHRVKAEASHVQIIKNMSRTITNFVEQRIRLYENKYYRINSKQESQRLLQTIERVYSQPGEKKQLVYLLGKLGVVTREQRQWQENNSRLQQYEEMVTRLRRKLKMQEEELVRLKEIRVEPLLLKKLTREVMRSIRAEARRERLRSSPEW